jgi:hypothetical protein
VQHLGLNGYVVIGSAVVGLLVGLTGAGGGALMTPVLILLFSVKPAADGQGGLLAGVGYWLVRTRIRPNGPGVPAPGHRPAEAGVDLAVGSSRDSGVP